MKYLEFNKIKKNNYYMAEYPFYLLRKSSLVYVKKKKKKVGWGEMNIKLR